MLMARLLSKAILLFPLLWLAPAADAATGKPSVSYHDYGPATRNTLDLYRPKSERPTPLILFVHGGGWSEGSKGMGQGIQPGWATAQGFAWAAMNYRLVPQVTVEDQARDVARAIGWMIKQSKRFNIDPNKIFLMGHSSGAHLAALVATDPQWLKEAGVPFEAIRGVISLDGAGIDVPGIMAAGANQSPFYANAFGTDVERQARLSPLQHIGQPDAPNWLFLYDQYHNQSAGFYAQRFAAAASLYATRVKVVEVFNTTHMRMLGELGKPDDAATKEVDAFLTGVLSRDAAE